MIVLNDREVTLLRRCEATGTAHMGYGEATATKALTARGLATWAQEHPLIATVRITDAGREALAGVDR